MGNLVGLHFNPQFSGHPFEANGLTIQSIASMDYDAKNSRVLFAVSGPRPSLRWISVKNPGDNGTIIFKSDNFTLPKASALISQPEGIAYDWVSSRIFWADSARKKIFSTGKQSAENPPVSFSCVQVCHMNVCGSGCRCMKVGLFRCEIS